MENTSVVHNWAPRPRLARIRPRTLFAVYDSTALENKPCHHTQVDFGGVDLFFATEFGHIAHVLK